jgi:hypothetical protein
VTATIHDSIAEAAAIAGRLHTKAETLPVPESAPIDLHLAAMAVADGLWLLGEQLTDAVRASADTEPLTASTPALEMWRRSVLDNPRRYGKLEQSAAWELTALECERSGNVHGAERARREAAYIVGVRGVAY